jgi:hypothetical protein
MAKRLMSHTTGSDLTRLLGFVPRQGVAALRAALDAIEGPAVSVRESGTVAALLQPEPPIGLLARGRADLLASLHGVQRRLEIACQAGAVLPVDPAAACLPDEAAAMLLEPAWPALAAALGTHGCRHQWDVVLRWAPEPVLRRRRADIVAAAAGLGDVGVADAVAAALRAERARREAGLLAALAPAVLAFAAAGPTGGDTEVSVTVLLPAHGEAVVEAALSTLSPDDALDASLDMRGPLPPLSFAPARVAKVELAEVVRAWSQLDLPERIDLSELHRHWRRRAFSVHPDRHPALARESFACALGEATEAYHLLRDMIRGADEFGVTRDAVLDRAGYRLILPPMAETEPPLALEPQALR